MELYREGFLNKAGKGVIQTHLHSWRPRYFVFDGKVLKYYKSKENLDDNLLGTIGVFEVESVGLMKGDKKSFQITTKPPKSRTYCMSGRSEDEVMGWVRVLEMGKAKMDKKVESEKSVSLSSTDSEITGPTKPPRITAVPSTYSYLSGVSPSSSPTTAKPKSQPVRSEYNLIADFAVTSGKDDGNDNNQSLYEEVKMENEDPTYEKVVSKEPDTSQKENTDQVYDSINESKTPPPCPKRDPSISLDDSEMNGSQDTAKGPQPPIPKRDPSINLYSNDDDNQGGEGDLGYDDPSYSKAFGIYDEINLGPPKDTKEIAENAKISEDKNTESGNVKPVYTQPFKGKSMKKNLSKKRIPGMLDIGEVSQDVESETAGGRETLKKGMTVPIGERFAFEELREMLQKYDKENDNNNNDSEEKVHAFKINENESAFSALKRFLDTYQVV